MKTVMIQRFPPHPRISRLAYATDNASLEQVRDAFQHGAKSVEVYELKRIFSSADEFEEIIRASSSIRSDSGDQFNSDLTHD